jgi:FAD/FMN-containing dehydrogenase
MSKAQKLQNFLEECHIRYVNPSSPDYGELRQQYILDTPAVPLAIARPQSAQDVTRIVSYAVAEGIEITVRSGGHDLYGRCFAQDALAIDMRDIAFVDVDPTGSSATIGGGILAGSLATELAKQKLATAYGSVPSVGYVGWSTHGGKL